MAPILPLRGQGAIPAGELDPARDPSKLSTWSRSAPLREQYIWTRDEGARDGRSRPGAWVFRRVFQIGVLPPGATLYVAAAGSVEVWLNGARLPDAADGRGQHAGYAVHVFDAAAALQRGGNAIVVCVRNLHGAHHTTTDPLVLQFVGGRALAVKLLAAPRGVPAEPLMLSDAGWRGRAIPDQDTLDATLRKDAMPDFDADAWPAVVSLGAIESNINFFQWNADAGMYDWPGYVGVSPFLRHYALRPVRTLDVAAGSAALTNVDALADTRADLSGAFRVELAANSDGGEPPALVLDFGREVAGRVHLVSAGDAPVVATAAYGESEQEALKQPFLGVRTIFIPAHGEAWGPKSAFRYVQLRFLTSAQFERIDLDGIAYPVTYRGSFSSSDALLSRIWETGAYTVHLCMQDGLWDGAKRDRARWAGDADVSGRVAVDAFEDRFLLEDTLSRLVGEAVGEAVGKAGARRQVNGIAGYSALWIASLAELTRRSGDREFLLRMRTPLLALLETMDSDIDAQGGFAPRAGEHIFVDWAPGLSADTPETRRATALEFLLAYREAAWLLDEMGERAAGTLYAAQYARMRGNLRATLMDQETHTFGASWQVNAMAVLSGAASEDDYAGIWNAVFAHVGDGNPDSQAMTPYYGYYGLRALALMGRRDKAVEWVRSYWGGMIQEGATSFWEAYDLRWPKDDFHASLQADGRTGYYVSLAHGWSAGPTAWLMDEVLGVRPTSAGFRTAVIQPELGGLQWIDGAVPTPHGAIHVHMEGATIAVELPLGVVATVLVKAPAEARLVLNGSAVKGTVYGSGANGSGAYAAEAAPSGYRSLVIAHPGRFLIEVR
jgi:alpha-L-rhamnosidase